MPGDPVVLRCYASTAGGRGLIPVGGTKILHAAWPKIIHKLNKKEFVFYCGFRLPAGVIIWVIIIITETGAKLKSAFDKSSDGIIYIQMVLSTYSLV